MPQFPSDGPSGGDSSAEHCSSISLPHPVRTVGASFQRVLRSSGSCELPSALAWLGEIRRPCTSARLTAISRGRARGGHRHGTMTDPLLPPPRNPPPPGQWPGQGSRRTSPRRPLVHCAALPCATGAGASTPPCTRKAGRPQGRRSKRAAVPQFGSRQTTLRASGDGHRPIVSTKAEMSAKADFPAPAARRGATAATSGALSVRGHGAAFPPPPL